MSSRRTVLKLIGGGTVLAAVGSAGFVAQNGPSASAREPWVTAGRYDDVRKRALSYAILAPNPHNMQPWQVRLDGKDALTLFCDKERLLPETDPFSRQITLGFGTFLELLRLGAAEEGYALDIDAFPEGENMSALDDRPIAHVRFLPGAAHPDPLFSQILTRRTNRNVYSDRLVPDSALTALTEASTLRDVRAYTIGDTGLAADLRQLTWDAHVVEMTSEAKLMESVDVMRIGKAEVSAQPNGLALEGPMMSLLNAAGMITRDTLGDMTSSGFTEGMKMFRKKAMSARAFGWLTNENRTRLDQIEAGRAYARLNLKATELGLSLHPWSQSLQEYAEMKSLYEKVHTLIGNGETIQMLVRIGYAGKVIAAPRYELETHFV